MFLKVTCCIAATCNQKIIGSLISSLNIFSAALLLPSHQGLKQLQKSLHKYPLPLLFLGFKRVVCM